MYPNWPTLLYKGIIPGPQENWLDFEKRALYLLNLTENEDLKDSLDIVEDIFQMRPSWVSCCYTKKGLTLLEAAATFIDDDYRVKIHIKPYFLQRKRLLFYKKNEIIAHEMIHAIRAVFEEPVFEEFLASRVFKSFWRRFFGSLIEKRKDLLLLAIPGVSLLSFLFFIGRLSYKTRLWKKKDHPSPLCLTDNEIRKGFISQSDGPRGALLDFLYCEKNSK